MIIWFLFLPYQLADFTADTMAKLRNTHVVLGFKNSLLWGVILGIVGLLIYFNGPMVQAPWTVIFVPVALCAFFFYWRWYHMPNTDGERAIRPVLRVFKPITQLMVPYLLILWSLM
jgi:4-hydroxybenzoate polyprenyltransferase